MISCMTSLSGEILHGERMTAVRMQVRRGEGERLQSGGLLLQRLVNRPTVPLFVFNAGLMG